MAHETGQTEFSEDSPFEKPAEAMQGLKNLDLTPDEVGKFQKAFKDPEFMKLFADYAKEISDPAAKAETDQYLRQVEAEGRTKEVYGKDVELITAEAGFVVKTKKKENNEKVFINICKAEKIKVASSQTVTHEGQRGKTWDVPFSLSALRKEKDNKGVECDTHDFVIATGTYRMVETNAQFRKFICETAIENVEKQRYGKYVEKQRTEIFNLDRAFTVPKIPFKGPKTGPSVLAVKNKNVAENSVDPKAAGAEEENHGGHIKPQSAPSSFNGLNIPDQKEQDKKLREATVEVAAKEKENEKDRASDFKFAFKGKKAPEPEVGECEPKYEVVHRGVMDLQEAWEGSADNRVKFQNTVPKALVVRVMLPRLASIANVDLDVSSTRVLLVKPHFYRLDLTLPHKVKSNTSSEIRNKIREHKR